MELDLDTLENQAEKIVGDIGIPPCPAILTRMLAEMRADDPDFNKIGKLIGADVSLAAAMVKTVNSPFFGLSRKASSVSQALALLGLQNAAQLVTGLLLRQAFPVNARDSMEEFWESSMRIAQIAAHIARPFSSKADDAYTFALFRDCGVPAMLVKFKEYRGGPGASRPDLTSDIVEAETIQFGISHPAVGFHLAKSWLLPESVCKAVLHHHDYAALMDKASGVPPEWVRIIMLTLAAEYIYQRHFVGSACTEWKCGGEGALEILGITIDELDARGRELAKDREFSAGAVR